MKALISPNEQSNGCFRVAQVESDENIFAVADPLFWLDCADNVVADLFWYDPVNQQIIPVPSKEPL